jgi:hypothetical protein
MPGDLELNANSEVIRLTHMIQARVAREERLQQYIQQFDTEHEWKADWFLALHRIGQSMAADSVQEINRKDLHQVAITEDYAKYLSDVSISDCSQVLAWRNWMRNGGIVDSDAVRVARDWHDAEGEIRSALFRLESSQTEDSVRSYLKRTYLEGRNSLIQRKAYWHFLAHPTNRREVN